MAMVAQKKLSKKTIGMLMVAVLFASLIGFVSVANAVISQGDTTVRTGNTFYAFVKKGERMQVSWNGTFKAEAVNEKGAKVTIASNGYTPTASSDGVWQVRLPDNEIRNVGGTYDMTVRDNTTEKKGRIWVYEDVIYQRWTGDGVFRDLNYFGVSDLGYIYQIKMNKMHGIDSKIALRSSGAAPNKNCNVESRSFESGHLDCGDKYRLFFEDPRIGGLPQTAKMGNETVPVLPNLVTSAQLKNDTKVAYTPNSDKVGGSFVISSYSGFSGTAQLQIDANNNGSYTDAVDVEQTIVVNGGKSAAWKWDGKNANGTDARSGGKARVVINKGGEAHLILIDVEQFGGLTMTRLNGESSPNSVIRWDDSKLTEKRATGTPTKTCVNGCNSNVSGGLHGWTRGTALEGDTESSSWGDGRYIDNWAYASVDATSPAIAIPAMHTLTFDATGGTINGAKSINRTNGLTWGTLPTATKANHDFQGWYTSATGGTEVTANSVAKNSITAYARWKPTDRTLTFDANGGTLSGAKSITKPHGSAWGTLSTATLANNDFQGWYTAKSGGAKVTATTVAAGNITVYAQWKLTPRTLTFDANGGTISGVKSITQPHGSKWGTLPTATLANNDFQGWYTAKTGGTQVTAATLATGNITVYAQWKLTPRTLTFDANGGTISGVKSITQPHGSKWGTLPTATLANNDFQGWFTAKTGGTQVTAATLATGNITVYAQWKLTPRTLTFDANGGTISGVKSITQPHGSKWGTLPTATLANNDFQGWYTAKTGGTQVTAATLATGNVTVYAQWKLTPRTLTFDANGGTISGVKSITQPHGSKWGTLPTATLANNDFQGWFTAKTGGTQVTAATIATGNVTVYAQWKLTPRTLTFDANGGTINGVKSITQPHGSPWGTLPGATLANNDFQGWFTAKTGGTQVTATTLATGNVTVYAQWKLTPRTLTFDATGGTISGVTTITKPHGSPWGTLPSASASGKVFLGWYTATTGGTQVTATTIATANITAYAQWRPSKFNVVFYGNAQMGQTSGTTASMSVNSGCTDCRLTPNGYTKTTGAPELIDHEGETAEVNSTFLGWSLDPNSRTGDIADRAVAGNLSLTDGATVRLYAIWDDAPRFIITDYPDRFFSLGQALSGAITEAELLSTVKATDKETIPLFLKTSADVLATGSDVGVTLFDYNAGDYTSLTDSAVVTATYKVKDEIGHVAYLRIRVTISDVSPVTQSEVQYLRGISPEFADKDAAAGGFPAESLWRTDPTRQAALNKAMGGSAATTYCLDADAVSELRSHLTTGLGNSENPDGLAASQGVLRERGSC